MTWVRWRRVVLAVGLPVLLVPALAIRNVRLADPTSARGIQLDAFTSLALPLYLPALAILLGVAVRRRKLLAGTDRRTLIVGVAAR